MFEKHKQHVAAKGRQLIVRCIYRNSRNEDITISFLPIEYENLVVLGSWDIHEEKTLQPSFVPLRMEVRVSFEAGTLGIGTFVKFEACA